MKGAKGCKESKGHKGWCEGWFKGPRDLKGVKAGAKGAKAFLKGGKAILN